MSRKRQIYKASELRNLQKDENSCVSVVPITRRLAIPPSFLNDMKSGIFYFLKSILKKYDRELDGILLGYQNVKVLFDENTGIVQMGKAETEVNVSVEFFIFQPKIGSCLEGIVNKKSNNHISCLVHKYFNATILKPEDVEFEDWICKDFQINDKITFRVKDLDFTRLLPYIEGIVDKDLLVKCQINRKKNLSFNNENESVVSTSEKEKNQNEQPENEERTFVNNYDGEKNDETDGVVKKKKKKKKKNSENNFNELTENCSKEEESNVDISSCGEKDVNEKVYKEKKKKKKKKENRGEECENEIIDKTEQLKELMAVENNQEVEENYKDDIKVKKKRKERKEKESMKLESKDAKNVNENPTEKGDLSFLYSTQIQPSTTVNKLEMTFCSPIPHEETLTKKKSKKEKKKEKELFKAIINTSEIDNLVEKEKEKNLKKLEKRKRKESGLSEEEKSVNREGCDVSLEKQKDRKAVTGGSEVNDVKGKEEEEGEKESFLKVLEIKKGKKSGQFEKGSDVSPKKKIKLSECKDSDETCDKNISGEKPKSELDQNKSVGEGDGETPDKPTTETSQKKKDKSVKESPKKINPKSDVKDNKPKSKVQSLLDELLQNQITKVQEQWNNLETKRSESDKESKSDAKEKKKKSKDKKKVLPVEKEPSNSDFLYEKLLKDAKSAFSGTTQEVEDKKFDAKGIKPASDLKETGEKSVGSKTKKETSKVEILSEKKSKKRKRKESGAEEPKSKKLKNGSMYDMAESSPEKGVKEDKSLFSDSESSLTEKNIPCVNGFASESEKKGKGKFEDLLSDLLKKEMEKLKKSSESSRGEEEVGKKGSKSEKSSKSGKKKKREKGKEKKEESLYEKLLREAKSLVNAKSEEVPVVTKKIRTIDSYFKPA